MRTSFLLLSVSLFGGFLNAANEAPTLPSGYVSDGPLPQPTHARCAESHGRLPVAVRPVGPRHDLVVLAGGRLWYYINESKRGKILFSEPIELTDTEGNIIETDYFYGIDDKKLMLHLAADWEVEVEIMGEDVPQLHFISPPAPAKRPHPQWQATADFDGDGLRDIVTGGADATTLLSARGINP